MADRSVVAWVKFDGDEYHSFIYASPGDPRTDPEGPWIPLRAPDSDAATLRRAADVLDGTPIDVEFEFVNARSVPHKGENRYLRWLADRLEGQEGKP